MYTLADILLFIGLAGLVTGLVRPSLFAKAVGHKKATRKALSLSFGAVMVLALVMLAVLPQKTPAKPVSKQTATTTAPATTQTTNATDNTDTTEQSQPTTAPTTTPALRQDLAFQGDPTYCDGHYKANSDGTTTWTLDIKHAGEVITHLSDNSGHLYRHDVTVSAGEYSYTAPVNINDVSEITGLLYVGNDSHPCNINPAS